MFKIKDGRTKFYQWDLNRNLIVDDETITQVHFCNRTDECSLVVETYKEDGLTLANVPNVLMQTDWDINVYAYDGKATKHSARFEVERRTKPTDYVYTETEVLKWETLEENINAAVDAVNETNEKANEALQEMETALADVNEAILNLYPVDTAKAEDLVYFDVAADNITLKEFIMDVSTYSSSYNGCFKFTFTHYGKNLFNPNEDVYEIGVITDTGEIDASKTGYAHTTEFTPVVPNADYVFSGKIVGDKVYNSVAFYDKYKNFISRYIPDERGTPAQFTTPETCNYIKFNIGSSVIGRLANNAQLEKGAVATDYEDYSGVVRSAYISPSLKNPKTIDLLRGIWINNSGEQFNFNPIKISTKRGANYLFKTNATLDIAYRVDPTLAYEKLKG